MSTGPAAALVTVELTTPAAAESGGSISVTTRLAVRSDGPRIVVQPSTSALVVLRGSSLVARAPGAEGPPVPLQLRAGERRPAQTLPERMSLVGCDGAPLPAGSYEVQAVVGYGNDPLNAGAGGQAGSFILVSEPQAITIA